MTWFVVWDDHAADEMRKLGRGNPAMAHRVGTAVARLAETGQGDLLKLRGGSGGWRLRVGSWRVRLVLNDEDQTLVVLHVRPRGRAYRDG
ncbi:MAG: hypothetical protein GEU73_11175 [Chloroflexi bacterium]|nr:hypothetical protein [Chloroflexota bacterium]